MFMALLASANKSMDRHGAVAKVGGFRRKEAAVQHSQTLWQPARRKIDCRNFHLMPPGKRLRRHLGLHLDPAGERQVILRDK